jgi:hypothetical protein
MNVRKQVIQIIKDGPIRSSTVCRSVEPNRWIQIIKKKIILAWSRWRFLHLTNNSPPFCSSKLHHHLSIHLHRKTNILRKHRLPAKARFSARNKEPIGIICQLWEYDRKYNSRRFSSVLEVTALEAEQYLHSAKLTASEHIGPMFRR